MQCNIAAIDLNARLNGTICMYDDKPYMVGTDQGSTTIMLYTLVEGDFFAKINAKNPLFDIATPPLGYFQYNGNQAGYCERTPSRQFRQGVTTAVLSFKYFTQPLRVNIRSQYIYDMMTRNYQSPRSILAKILDGKIGQYALSNDCAITVNEGIVKIFFKHEEVAFSTIQEMKKNPSVIHIPESPKAWIIEKYLSSFDWKITIGSVK